MIVKQPGTDALNGSKAEVASDVRKRVSLSASHSSFGSSSLYQVTSHMWDACSEDPQGFKLVLNHDKHVLISPSHHATRMSQAAYVTVKLTSQL